MRSPYPTAHCQSTLRCSQVTYKYNYLNPQSHPHPPHSFQSHLRTPSPANTVGMWWTSMIRCGPMNTRSCSRRNGTKTRNERRNAESPLPRHPLNATAKVMTRPSTLDLLDDHLLMTKRPQPAQSQYDKNYLLRQYLIFQITLSRSSRSSTGGGAAIAPPPSLQESVAIINEPK